MKKMSWLEVIGSATAMLLVAGSCWAAPSPTGCKNINGTPKKCPQSIVAPEIDVGAGSGAIALLVGGLLLAAEKRRRSS